MKVADNFLIILTILFLMTIGCAAKQQVTSEYLQQQMLKVDYSDGINKNEAIILAQNYLLKNPPDKSTTPTRMDVDINRLHYVYKHQNRFYIQFDFKFEGRKPFMYPFYWSVQVDKDTGKIISSGFAGHK